MNILIMAKEDFSGAGYALMQAINLYTEHLCRAITYKRMGLQYPVNIYQPHRKELIFWLEWADVLNLHESLPNAWREVSREWSTLPVVRTYHGSWYRSPLRRREQENARCKAMGWVQTALTIDLATYGPRWIGRAMPDLSYLYNPDDGDFIVSQAATRKVDKGTEAAERALKGLAGVQFDFVTKITNEKCLRRKAKAHLTVDKGPVPGNDYSHGTSALESWSMGMPVISSPELWVHEADVEYIGYSPYYYCQPDEEAFRAAVIRFRDDEAFYEHWCSVGDRYIREFHAPSVVAEKFIAACRETL